MNELRMYVEHLFEGRVLTAEMIELKEEIYGNLVARFEDLVAQGVDAAEAVAQAKESVTSVDELLEDGASDAEGASPEEREEDSSAIKDEKSAPGQFLTGDGPEAPEELGGQNEKKSTRKFLIEEEPGKKKWAPWKIVLVVLVAAAAVACVSLVACGAVAFKAIDKGAEFTNAHSVKISEDGISIERGEDGVTIDENGNVRYDGELASIMVDEVVESTSEDVKPYVGTSLADVTMVEQLVRVLPLGGYTEDIQTDTNQGVLSITYKGVPDVYDGEDIELPLAYAVTSLLTAMPELKEVRVTIFENETFSVDENAYVFTRDAIERAYGFALTSDLVNEAGWAQIKTDNLYKHDFAEDLVDAAERD